MPKTIVETSERLFEIESPTLIARFGRIADIDATHDALLIETEDQGTVIFKADPWFVTLLLEAWANSKPAK